METKQPFYRKFIGSRAFYKMALGIGVPIIIQNGFSNFVNLLDNIMVGSMGTDQMSGVAIANQLMYIYNVCIYGGMSGVGIFTAQFFGNKDDRGVRRTAQIKLILAFILAGATATVFTLWGEPLIRLFLHEGSETGDIGATLRYGLQYLGYMRWVLLPYALVQAYSSLLRETGHTVPPMVAGITSVLVNLLFNWLLIFGKCGFPAMGVAGAAIATIISRTVEVGIVATRTYIGREEMPYFKKLWRFEPIPGDLLWDVLKKATPVLVNEALWSAASTMVIRCYSTRGLAVVAATSINSVISQLFNVVFMSMGTATGIIVGKLLGASRMREARDTDTKLITLSAGSCVIIGGLMFLFAPVFPKLYNTTAEVRNIAEKMIMITAATMPLRACATASYFTLRSGGKTGLTFLYDSGYLWGVQVTTALAVTGLTSLPIIPVFAIVSAVEAARGLVGLILVRTDIWIHNIVKGH